jgi:hypothetical protein
MKMETRSAVLLSLPHPVVCFVILGMVRTETLLGLKGGAETWFYEGLSWVFLILTFPGLLATFRWWPERFIYPYPWQHVYCMVLVFISWFLAAAVTYGFLWALAKKMEKDARRIPPSA